MSDDLQTARACARALFAVAHRAGRVAETAADLDRVAVLLRDSEPFRLLAVRRENLAPAARRRRLDELVGDRVGPETRHLLDRMADWNQLHVLPELIGEFAAERRRLEGRSEVRLTLAQAPEDADLEALRGRLAGACAGGYDLEVRTDPALVGGLTLQIDDRMIDASISGRLARLHRGLHQVRQPFSPERNAP